MRAVSSFLSSGTAALVLYFCIAGTAGAELLCHQCHGSKNPVDNRPVDSAFRNTTTGGFQGNHRTHLPPDAGPDSCAICHPGSASYSAGHRDGTIQLAANINDSAAQAVYRNGSTSFTQTPLPTLATCTNVNCHFERTTPAWGSDSGATTCNSCHDSPPADGSHPEHAAFSCIKCHPNHTSFFHATSAGKRPLSVGFPAAPNNGIGTYSGMVTYPAYLPSSNPARNGSCQNLYCHTDGKGGPPAVQPVWGTAPSGTCGGCHGAPPGYVNGDPKANSHARHSYMSCAKCHWPTTQTGHSVVEDSAHLNRQFDIDNSTGTLGYSYAASGGSCSGTFGCHNMATWGGTVSANFSDCLACHKTAMGGARQIVDSNGDGSGSGGDFRKTSHHVLNYRTIPGTVSPSFNPAATSIGIGGFTTPENAYLSDANNATCTINGNTQLYEGYNVSLPGISQAITKVEVGVRGFYTITPATSASTARVYVQVSWDNGATWGSEQFVTLPKDIATTTNYLSFTATGGWNASKLSDANFKVRIRNYFTGTYPVTNYLDWLPVRVTYSSYDVGNSVTNADCLVCHDTSQHPGGAVRLKDADTGAIYVYDPANPATAETFCLSCHDTNGANGTMAPFSDGKSLGVNPYAASKTIKTSWEKTYGHKQQGLTCLGNGNPATGCHSNGHGSEFVGMLSRNMTLPRLSSQYFSPADEVAYDICFNCHDSYPRVTKEAIFGYRRGGNYDTRGDGPPPYDIPNIMTKFRDKNGQGSGKAYDDPNYWGGMLNLHYFHIQGGTYQYRDLYPSTITCITCHNVHGSNTQWGAVYDEMQYTHFTGTGADQYGKIGAAGSTLNNFPTSCRTFNCHSGMMGVTSNWFEPAGE